MNTRHTKQLALAGKILVGCIFILPVFIAIAYSFHPNIDFAKGHLSVIPEHPTLENYIYIFENVPTLNYFKNTLIVVLIALPTQMILNTIAAYAFSFFDFPGKNALFTIFLTSMMIPADVTIIANYITVQKLGLINTHLGMACTSLTGVTGIFMLRQSMLALPKELWEAAKMDGSGKMRYLFRVVFPLCKPTISALAITSFIGIYSAYLWPMLVTTTNDKHTIQMGMAQLMTGTGSRYGYVLAGAVVSMIIPLIAFVIGQDHIVEGMTAGSVKS